MKTINDIIWNDEDGDITIQSIPINCLTISCGDVNQPDLENAPTNNEWMCFPWPMMVDTYCSLFP
ncbi:MAG: hypothetical protein PHY13_01195 [Clostridia bacterium]|nr:hypothetical protein [Clostridia bacterium]MDD4542373.1 hypothetical protein [Clostridia bacterium]